MRSLDASTTYTIPFSTSKPPDALPTATAYADETSLGVMTVTAESGTNEYSVDVVLPSNVTTGQIITVKPDWAVDSAAQSTVTLLVGQVRLNAEIASAVNTKIDVQDACTTAIVNAGIPRVGENHVYTNPNTGKVETVGISQP